MGSLGVTNLRRGLLDDGKLLHANRSGLGGGGDNLVLGLGSLLRLLTNHNMQQQHKKKTRQNMVSLLRLLTIITFKKKRKKKSATTW